MTQSLLAEADGAAVIGALIVLWIIGAVIYGVCNSIYQALIKPKSYDVEINGKGTIRER